MNKYVIGEKGKEHSYWGGNGDFGKLILQTREWSIPTGYPYFQMTDGILLYNSRPVIPFVFHSLESAQQAINYVPRNKEVEIIKVKITMEIEE